jgi:hypothetical protein
VELANFCRKADRGYRHFQKKFGETGELYKKNQGLEHALSHLKPYGTRPVFSKKAGCR